MWNVTVVTCLEQQLGDYQSVTFLDKTIPMLPKAVMSHFHFKSVHDKLWPGSEIILHNSVPYTYYQVQLIKSSLFGC